ELRVARKDAKGLTNKEIANTLNLSVRTIENHVSRILDKKNFANRVELTRHMLSLGENMS
ncbi:MAG TPA: LuxR C-terminal-related transcriptional regulator, partial [Pyrinomonadaceae bacterium]|nr:LuxR C-terminal-related transcriptional regulator [Pyrinomonadaceae bacterium]